MASRALLGHSITVCLALIVAGCGDSKMFSVSGTVTLDGKALPNAGVIFTPPLTSTQGKLATGRTDASGRFSLSTHNRRGAMPAEYAVAIVAQKDDSEDKKPSDDLYGAKPRAEEVQPQTPDGRLPSAPKLPTLLIPEKYTRPETSGLSFVIGPGRKTHFTIELQSAP
jgi:hypothetical protein